MVKCLGASSLRCRFGRHRCRCVEVAGYPYLPATKADLLHRLGRNEEATRAYHAAHELSDNAAERDFLAERARETSTQPSR